MLNKAKGMENYMKLYDFIKLTECDYDTYDTIYDAVVTVCYIEENEENDFYDKFCIELMKKVNVEKQSDDALIVEWTELIQKNMDKFKEFTNNHWRYNYEDDEDEFIYQWIEEIHSYMAGYVSEKFYETLFNFVETLEA